MVFELARIDIEEPERTEIIAQLENDAGNLIASGQPGQVLRALGHQPARKHFLGGAV